METEKLIFNASRARARAAALLLAGVITPAEAAQRVRQSRSARRVEARDMARGRMAARELFAALAGRGPRNAPPLRLSGDMSGDDLRAAGAGLLTLAEVEALARAEAVESINDERRRAARRMGQTSGRAAVEAAATASEYQATGAALARARAGNSRQAALVAAAREAVEADGGTLAPAGALGAAVVDVEGGERDKARRIIAAVSVKGAPSVELAAENERAARAGLLSAYEWALLTLAAVKARQVRARAAILLRDGTRGRILARGLKMARAKSARWMRSNSRREAANLDEVGAAAGVDDRGAWADWTAELVGVSRAVFVTCAAAGAAIVEQAHAPCHALVMAGLGAPRRDWTAAKLRIDAQCDWDVCAPLVGSPVQFRAAIVGRAELVPSWGELAGGKRRRLKLADGTPGALVAGEWEGRGVVWAWASRGAGRELHSARYGRGGRDGREVAANWTASGTIKGADCGRVHVEGGEVWRAPVARRGAFLRDVRGAVALDLRARRAAVGIARELVALAVDGDERARRGSALGAALCALVTSKRRAVTLGAALAGESIGSAGAEIVEGGALTGAGRKMAARFRAAFPALAVVQGGKRAGKATSGAGAAAAALAEAAAVARAAALA